MGLFEHMHIKGHTAGSSNELSFDVLRKASGEGDASAKTPGIPAVKGKGGTINLSRMEAASAAAADAYAKSQGIGNHRKGSPLTTGSHGQSYVLSGSAEVARRKKARHGFRLFTRVMAVLVIILLLCAGIFLNDRISQDRMSFKTRLTNLTMQLANIDKDLVLIDQLATHPLDNGEFDQMKTLLGEMPGIMTSLVGVEEQAQEIQQLQPAGYNADALADLVTATQAREELLSCAARLFEISVQAGTYIQQADTTWDLVVESTRIAGEAVDQANKATTPEAIEENSETIRTAMGDLSSALRQLEFMKTNLNSVDLASFVEYATAKRQALQYALDTNEALLDLNREEAQKMNVQYNQAEKEAAERAASISSSISDVVRTAYQSRVEAALASYNEARTAVIEADYALRQRIA